MSEPQNVLVTCGGKWVGIVLQLKLAMRHVAPLAGGRLLVADRASLTPAGQFADGSFVVPAINEPDYVDCLLDICRRQAVRVVIPLIDIDMVRLAPHASQFADVGTHVVSPPAELVELCFDKANFSGFADAAGIPVPRRYTAEQLDGAPYPLFAKPLRGFGSIGSCICRSAEEAQRALATNPELAFEQYIEASEVSVDCYLAAGGRCTVQVQRVRDKVIGGEAVQTHTVRLPAIRKTVNGALEALARRGLRGPLNVQVFATGRPPVIDVNPRLGSASVLSNMASHGRLFRSVLAESCGLAAEGDPNEYEEGLHLYRFLGDVFHDGSRASAVLPGEWIGDPCRTV